MTRVRQSVGYLPYVEYGTGLSPPPRPFLRSPLDELAAIGVPWSTFQATLEAIAERIFRAAYGLEPLWGDWRWVE